VLKAARNQTPNRWGKRSIRNCEPIGPATLNSEKEVTEKAVA
jgi:hypothetical protein